MTDNRDKHMYRLRNAHRLITIGVSKRKACKELGINCTILNRLLKEYQVRRKAGTLFVDIERVEEADLYTHTFQMKIINDRQKARASTVAETAVAASEAG